LAESRRQPSYYRPGLQSGPVPAVEFRSGAVKEGRDSGDESEGEAEEKSRAVYRQGGDEEGLRRRRGLGEAADGALVFIEIRIESLAGRIEEEMEKSEDRGRPEWIDPPGACGREGEQVDRREEEGEGEPEMEEDREGR
jgi:hypothetical protein